MREDLEFRLQREGLKVAPLSKRIIAMSIDDLLVSFLIVIAFADSFLKAKSYAEVISLTNSLFIYIFIAYTLYHWIFVALYGKTIGKMITKIRVVDIQTLDTPSHFRSFIRSLFRNFDEMFFYLGMLYAFADRFNRAIHDIIGNSIVIED